MLAIATHWACLLGLRPGLGAGQLPGPQGGRGPVAPALCATRPLMPDLVNTSGARASALGQALTGCCHGMSLRRRAVMVGGSVEPP